MGGGTFNRKGWKALSHLPDAGGLPFMADVQVLNNALAYTRSVAQHCGPVARTVLGGQPQVLLLSAQAMETVLLDRDRIYSARGGWEPLLGDLFTRGLLLRDGEEHRHHRRLMLPAVRREAMAGYLRTMQGRIQDSVTQWYARGQLAVVPELKTLMLSLAADIFLGLSEAADIDRAQSDFVALVDASTALLRLNLPGLKYARGLKARRSLLALLRRLITLRRRQPSDDLLSQLCEAQDEEGQRLSDSEIADHLVFLMMAAHDTTASALASMMGLLGGEPEWQSRLREEAQSGLSTQATAVIRETLRLHPPVPMFSRRTLAESELHGQRIPAGTLLSLFPLHNQRDAQWWDQPDAFRPERWLSGGDAMVAQPADAHPYAWTPFGGGVHLCLGLHLAEAQMKLVLQALLLRGSWSWAPGYRPHWRHAPISHPDQNLPLVFEAAGDRSRSRKP